MLPLTAFLLLQGEKPTATVKLNAPTAVIGKELKGTLTLTLPDGLHGYQNPPADEFENPIKLAVVEKGFKFGKVEYPKGVDFKMEGAEKGTKIYEGTINIPFTLIATAPLPKGATANVNFKIDYQLCSATSCWPPSSIVVKAPLKVVAAPKKGKA